LKNKSRNERLNQLSDALFGGPGDYTAAEAADDLEAAGVDRESLYLRMYDGLCMLAREYRLRQGEVPPRLEKALEDLRKRVGAVRTKEEVDNRADSTISKTARSCQRAAGLHACCALACFQCFVSEQNV